MAGEILAEDNSPMMMTVGQYNDRVAYTWKLATEAEQERIIKLLENDYWHHLSYLPRLIEDKATLVHDKECIGCQLLTSIKGEN
jgi:hypothetical protein